MSRVKHVQTNFTAGELSPLLAGRGDLSKYSNGARGIENCIILPTGGARRRTGFRYIGATKDNGVACLIPFSFSTEQSYILEMGNQYMRVYKEGEAVYSPDEYTKLLLHMNGMDGSTVFKDDGYTGHGITANGDAQIDTSQYNLGDASGYFDGVGDYISIADHADWYMGLGKFTIDFWVRISEDVGANGGGIFTQRTDATHKVELLLLPLQGQVRFKLYNGTDIITLSGSVVGLSKNNWHHIAVIRGWDGDAIKWALCINGNAHAAYSDTVTWPDLTGNIEIGRYYNEDTTSQEYHNGWLDEFRISNIARWESPFNRHTIQYPNAGPGGGLGAVYELATPYLSGHLEGLKFEPSADTLYITHPAYPTYKLVRLDHNDWEIIQVAWRPAPSAERPVLPAVTLTPAATTGTGINFTTSAAYWLAGDVGRSLVYGTARAIITAITSTTIVVCDIISAFPDTDPIAASSWSLQGSPTGSVTPSGDKAGSIITLTSATNVWRAADIGKHVLIHGGSVHITGYTSATVVSGEVMYTLSAITATTVWSLEENVWTSSLGYPRAIGFFEQRLGLAGTHEYPQDIWGSSIDLYEDMSPGPNDDQAIYYRLPKYNPILWIETIKNVMLGTAGGIMSIGSRSADEPLSPTNVFATKESGYGSADIQPVTIGDTIIYVERLGVRIRELKYSFESGANGGYTATDMTVLADHITKGGISVLAYQQSPYSTVWGLRADGVLIGLTYLREHDVIAWHRHTTDGEFESIAVIPGDYDDELWAVVKRTVDSNTVRYIERLDPPFLEGAALSTAFFVDSGFTYSGDPATVITGLDHLEGEDVSVLADGLVITGHTVAGNEITLASAASLVHVGLPYNSDVDPVRVGSVEPGQIHRISQLRLRLDRCGLSVKMGVDSSHLRSIALASSGLFTGDKEIDFPGAFDEDGYTYVRQDLPLPMTLLAIMYELETTRE